MDTKSLHYNLCVLPNIQYKLANGQNILHMKSTRISIKNLCNTNE